MFAVSCQLVQENNFTLLPSKICIVRHSDLFVGSKAGLPQLARKKTAHLNQRKLHQQLKQDLQVACLELDTERKAFPCWFAVMCELRSDHQWQMTG